jgi:hypothetical protein
MRDKGSTATCPKCNVTWNVYGASAPVVPETPSEWRVEEVRETHRFEQPLGTDRQVVDAKDFDSDVTQKLSFSRQWRQSVTIESEKISTQSSGVSLAVLDIATLESNAETVVRDNYSTEDSSERTSTREVQVTVKGGTAMEVLLHWKKVWQGGVVVFEGPNGATIEMPFALAVDVTFDQEFASV